MPPAFGTTPRTRRWSRRFMFTIAIGALLGASAPAAQAARAACPTRHPARSTIYVPNVLADTVSVVDGTSDTIVATIPVGHFPYTALVTRDGSQVFVADSSSDEVSIISTATNKVTHTVPTDGGPFQLATDPRGAFVYVANSAGTVSVISTATDKVVHTIPIGGLPVTLAVNHADTKLYVTEMEDDMTVVNLPSDTVDTVIHMGSAWNYGLAISPDDTKVYVASHFSPNQVGAMAGVEVIDARSDTVTGQVHLGLYLNPFDMALSPDGRTAYIPESGSGTISVLDTSTLTVTDTIHGFVNPMAITLSPAGRTAYVSDIGTNTVSVLNLADGTVTHTISGFSYPEYAGILTHHRFMHH